MTVTRQFPGSESGVAFQLPASEEEKTSSKLLNISQSEALTCLHRSFYHFILSCRLVHLRTSVFLCR